MARNKSQGRKKIEMKKIESEDARRIAFSKRRSGLFKKASELSTLCGVQIAIIVYSIGGKAFSFGHPSVESAINLFENANQQKDDYITRFANSIRDGRLQVLKEQFNDLSDKLAIEKKKSKSNKPLFQNYRCQSFEDFIDKLDPSEFDNVKEKLTKWKQYLAQGKEINGSPIPYGWLKL